MSFALICDSVYCELPSENIISKLHLKTSAWQANDKCEAETLELFLHNSYYTFGALQKVTEK